MKKTEYKTVIEERKKVVSVTYICNKCGGEDIVQHNEEGYSHTSKIKGFHVGFGYESEFDDESWEFDLCENCLINFIKCFKYTPKGFMRDNYSLIDNDEEHQQVFDNYIQTNKWDELLLKSYEELDELNNGYMNTEYLNEAVKKYHPNKPLLEIK